jgi:hypothetical protein
MIACRLLVTPQRDAGVIVDESKDEVLPLLFRDHSEATRFLEAAERVGLNLWPGMGRSELSAYVNLWRDADKR